MRRLVFLLLTGLVLLTSCKTLQDIAYLQDVPIVTQTDGYIRLMPGDKLNIYVHGLDEQLMNLFNISGPFNMKAIQEIADKCGLKVIYDAAHAFGVEVNSESMLTKGDLSTLIKQVDVAIVARQKVANRYREVLRNVPCIRFFDDIPNVRHNYNFPLISILTPIVDCLVLLRRTFPLLLDVK